MSPETTRPIRFERAALLLIDNQVGISTESGYFGKPKHSATIFHVAHHSVHPESPLYPTKDTANFFPFARPRAGEAVFFKNVNSAFIGTQLEQAIKEAGIKELTVAGLVTEHCASTSVRMANNLDVVGKDGIIWFAGDAVASFEHGKWDAETVQQVNLACLEKEFADVESTDYLVSRLTAAS